MNGVSGDRDKVGDVFVAIVEVVGRGRVATGSVGSQI